MKQYKFHIYVHLFNLFSIMLGIGSFVDVRVFRGGGPFDFILIVASLIALYNLLRYLTTNYIVAESSLIKSSMFKTEKIDWGDIESINILPASKEDRLLVGIYGHGKNVIFVSYWIKEYKELLREIIDKCSEYSNVSIEPRLLDWIRS